MSVLLATDLKPGDTVRPQPWWRGPYAYPNEGSVREVKGAIIWVDFEGDPIPELRRFEAFELELLSPDGGQTGTGEQEGGRG